MKTIEISIKKPYAAQVIDDLERMEAIEIVRKPVTKMDTDKLWGSWKKENIETIDANISKMRDEWQRDF